jgi:hypothetical protein
MGKLRVNNREVVAPESRMTVKEIKELALVPMHEKLYGKDGRILRDDEVVGTEDTEFGAVTDWTRGVEPPLDDEPERCCVCGEPILDDDVTFDFDEGRMLPAHGACLPAD